MSSLLIFQDDRFLSIAVQLGRINSETRKYALQQKRLGKLNQENRPVGKILMDAGLLTSEHCDEILREQSRRRTARLYKLKKLSPVAPSLAGQRLLVVSATVIGVMIAHRFKVALDPAIQVAAFLMVVAITILEYRALHSAPRSLFRALVLCCAVLILAAFFYSIFTFTKLDEIANLHNTPDTKSIVDSWLFRVKASLLALGVAVMIIVGYAVWKFHSVRYAQARMGLIKDTIIRVEEILRDTSKTIQERQEDAINVVLKGIRDVVRVSLPDRALKRLPLFFRGGRDQISVLYFTPEPANRRFRLDGFAYPREAPEKVREGFRWMQEHHFPTFFDQARFDEIVHIAKGRNPRGWRTRYLNVLNRHEFVSICGWIYATKKTVISPDASKCLAYDGRFFDGMKDTQGMSKEELSWITFGSFVGCPVVDQNGDVASILIVGKSRGNVLENEDLEAAVIASQLIRRILSIREGVNGG